ncbi:serine hydrolase domain-containing protein [Roseibium sp. SCP14]|uniref:serine hydrolase domain-containing protein n=1 Tax=Roseibium sp. SCP14 TaxID=3141375 RepID=UPI003334C776
MITMTRTLFNSAKVRNWLSNEIAAGRLTGGAIEIRQSDKPVFSESFGTRNSDGGAVTQDTMFWIASMTKPIVSVAAMRLVEKGKLSLNDPVSRFIPGFGEQGVLSSSGDVEDVERPPTVLDLLTHTSGVTYGWFGEDGLHRRYQDTNVYNFRSDNASMAETLASLPLLHQPGKVFEYGMSTDLLGRIVEVQTGQQLDDAVWELVLDPLNMRNTDFQPQPDRIADIPASPVRDTLAPLMTTDQSWWSGGSGLCSTVSDYMRFARMLKNGGHLDGITLLRPETLALMLRNHLPENVRYGSYTPALGITAPWPDNGLGFGLGFAVRTKRLDHLPGGAGEFLWPGISGANFWVDPENELIVVFMTHAPDHRTVHRIGLRNAVYAGLNGKVAS